MKKLIAILLSLTFILSVSVFAVAVTLTSDTSYETKDVQAMYVPATSTDKIYSVDIQWGAMTFNYNQGGGGTWDPSQHKYTNSISPGWVPTTPEANVISVTNHSNTAVKCNIAFVTESNFSFVTGTLDNSILSLPSAEEKSIDDSSLTKTSTLTLSGTPSSNFGEYFLTVGTLTLSLTS